MQFFFTDRESRNFTKALFSENSFFFEKKKEVHCAKIGILILIKVKTRTKKNKVKTCKLNFNHGSHREGGCVLGPTKTGVYSNRMRHEA